MSQSISSYSPAQVAAISALSGAVMGYTFAPEKYNLEQLLTQKADVFEKSIPLKAAADDKLKASAYNSILEARKAVVRAAKDNKVETKIAELIKAPNLEKAYDSIRGLLPKARAQNAVLVGVVAGIFGAFTKILFGNSNS